MDKPLWKVAAGEDNDCIFVIDDRNIFGVFIDQDADVLEVVDSLISLSNAILERHGCIGEVVLDNGLQGGGNAN